MSEVGKHIGHRAVLLDERRLRCVDCDRIVLLPVPVGSTSNVFDPPRRDDERCALHGWERQGACRACRGEQLAAGVAPVRPSGASPSPEYREARERLAGRRTA